MALPRDKGRGQQGSSERKGRVGTGLRSSVSGPQAGRGLGEGARLGHSSHLRARPSGRSGSVRRDAQTSWAEPRNLVHAAAAREPVGWGVLSFISSRFSISCPRHQGGGKEVNKSN